MFLIIQICVVIYEHITGYHFFHNRMTPVLYFDHALSVEPGPHIMILFGNQRQRSINIKTRDNLCAFLNPYQFVFYLIPERAVSIIFKRSQLILGIEYHVLEFLKPGRDITFCIRQGLLSHIIGRHHILIGIGNLKIIPENFIVTDFKILYARPFPFLFLKPCQPAFSFGFCMTQLIYIRIKAFPDDPALTYGKRRFLDYRRFNGGADILKLIQILI